MGDDDYADYSGQRYTNMPDDLGYPDDDQALAEEVSGMAKPRILLMGLRRCVAASPDWIVRGYGGLSGGTGVASRAFRRLSFIKCLRTRQCS